MAVAKDHDCFHVRREDLSQPQGDLSSLTSLGDTRSPSPFSPRSVSSSAILIRTHEHLRRPPLRPSTAFCVVESRIPLRMTCEPEGNSVIWNRSKNRGQKNPNHVPSGRKVHKSPSRKNRISNAVRPSDHSFIRPFDRIHRKRPSCALTPEYSHRMAQKSIVSCIYTGELSKRKGFRQRHEQRFHAIILWH